MLPTDGQTPTSVRFEPRLRSGVGGVGVARRGLGLVSLAGLVWCALIMATAAASHPLKEVPGRIGGFPGWLRGPLSVGGYVLAPSQFAALVLVMVGCYVVALACTPALGARWVVGAVLLLHVIFLLGPPLFSADVFGYVDWARMGALHGLNPYVTASGSVASDAVYGYLGWHRGVSPYGPLFTLLTYGFVPLGVSGALWALKIIVAASSLGCAALIWRCAARLGHSRVTGVAFYGLNPAVLVYAVGGFHNDTILTMAVLGAIWLVVCGRELAGGAMEAVAVTIKASAGVVFPFLVLGARGRSRTVLGALVAGVVLLALSLAAFDGHALGFVSALSNQENRNSGTSVPAQLGDWFGWVGSPPGVRTGAAVVGIGVILGLLVRTWRGADWIESAGWATLAVMLTSAYLLPWYLVWLVPLAALAGSRLLQLASVGMTLFVILVRVVPTFRPVLVPRVTVGMALGALTFPITGGPLQPGGSSRLALQEPVARAYERAWERQHRITTGRDVKGVAKARSTCHRVGSHAPGSHDWTCRVSYLTHGGAHGQVTYTVHVDARGCFAAKSSAYPTQVFERILARPNANPLAQFVSCP